MRNSNTITIIGSGNVAQQLGPALKNCGYRILEICSRNAGTGRSLAKKLNAAYLDDASKVTDTAGIVIIAVKDDAIQDVAKKLPALKKSLVIHTSGATDISVLKNKFKKCGVIWQVQTIKARKKLDFRKVPLVIEANNPPAKKTLTQLARSLSGKVYALNSHQRRVLHLGAVFVNNFPNHLMYLSKELLRKHGMPFEIFTPLIHSTIQSALQDPYTSQTGPAKRNDRKTMKAHLKLLKEKNYRNLYKTISKSITNLYN